MLRRKRSRELKDEAARTDGDEERGDEKWKEYTNEGQDEVEVKTGKIMRRWGKRRGGIKTKVKETGQGLLQDGEEVRGEDEGEV